MGFHDREDAAVQLARALEGFAGKHPLILAIPRGAVPMGRVIAERLGGDLDVALVHKIGAPFQPEYAIGAVSELGGVHVTDPAAVASIPRGDFEALARAELARLLRRRALYSPVRAASDPAGRIVILVDDGIATGSTMLAAVRAARARRPALLVVATPVISRSAARLLRAETDRLVALAVPERFGAVGEYYDDFGQVSDEKVVRLLRESGRALKRA